MSEHYAKVKSFLRKKFLSRNKFRNLSRMYYYRDLEKILRFLVRKNSTLLEVGCGDGSVINSLNPKEGIGAYITVDHLRFKLFKNLKFIEMLPEKIEINKKFDYILYINSLGYIEDIQRSFQEIKKFCRKDTRVILVYHNYLWEPFLKFAEILGIKEKQSIKLNWLSFQDIGGLLRLAGFDVVKRGERMLMPFYIPIISTLLNKYLCQLPIIRKLCLTQYVVARPILEENRKYTISVIIPARNEADNIEEAVVRIPNLGKRVEIIFVEGNSTDNTRGEIKRVIKKYPNKDIKLFVQDGIGKADAVRKGFENAKGEVLMILDADLTVPPEDLTKFYDAISNGSGEFVNGSRLVYPMEKQAMRNINLIGNKIFSLIFSWLLNQRIKDTLCGTKVLFRKDYEKIKEGRSFFGEFDPFGDFDLLFGASKLNLKIVEIPVHYKERKYGATNISRFRHGWMLLKMALLASRKMKFI